MVIYDLLFYHAYELALKSRSNRDMPMFSVITIITLCFMFNVFAILLFAEGAGIINGVSFPKSFRILVAILFLGVVTSYYLINNRYQKIYSRMAKRRNGSPSIALSVLVIVTHYVLSFLVALLAGLYKNKDWVFSQ